jgi:mevalonate kinase
LSNQIFPSKVLLFGEYSLLLGSMGFAFPLTQFSGSLKFNKEHSLDESLKLDSFLLFLKNSALLKRYIDDVKLEKDIKEGLYFDSSIPQGYGVGSSGALCAAILNSYLIKSSEYNVNEIHDLLSWMEGFYHGTSSGIDPLVSYLNKPIIIKNRKEVQIIDSFDREQLKNIYLIDTGKSRVASAFILEFLRRVEQKEINDETKKDLVAHTDALVELFIAGNPEWANHFRFISQFQSLYLSDMIPQNIKPLWIKGLDSNEFWFKHCGAGGGGFILALVNNKKSFKEQMFKQKFNYFNLYDS